MQRSSYKVILVAAAALVAAGLLGWFARYTVAGGERRNEAVGLKRGYRIEQYAFRNGMRLTIWNSQGMVWTYEGHANVKNVVAERWLAGDRAVYLDLILEHKDSATEEVPVKVIYDFQKGELHTVSRWGLWRLWDSTVPENKNWMTESEFQEVLTNISRDKGDER